jgi:putative transposase
MIDTSEEILSISKQCELLDLARSSYYYDPIPESELNLRLMRMIDKQYLITPFYGSRRMTQILKKQTELVINRKRTQRLMQLMGLEAMYPRPNTSAGNKNHYKYPYLLKNLPIIRPNQAWGSDITYIPVEAGFLYLVAVIDLYSRYVLSWALSNNLESEFCLKAIQEALRGGVKPEIKNSDQGVQYTSKAYCDLLKSENISISMSGKGRCWDNIFVERLWRALKYEEIYLKDYSNCREVEDGISWYFSFYNNERPHQMLNYYTPADVYFGRKILA